MADYDGIAVVPGVSEGRGAPPGIQNVPNGRGRVELVDVYAGIQSLAVNPGGWVKMFCALDADTGAVSVWALAPPGGKVGLKLLDLGLRVLATDYASGGSGSPSWELLSVAHGGEKGIFIIALYNFSQADGDSRAFFDSVSVS